MMLQVLARRLVVALLAVSLLLSPSCGGHAVAAEPTSNPAKADYFVSSGTVIIGCTAGAAAGALAAGMPITAAIATGAAIVPTAWTFMTSITVWGCVVGAASGAVAIGTAWLLDRGEAK